MEIVGEHSLSINEEDADRVFVDVVSDEPLISKDTPDAKPQEVKGGSGTVFSSCFSLTNTIMGAGILTLPYAFKEAGLAFSIVFLLFMGVLANFSFRFLVACSDETGEYTFKGLAVRAFGKVAAPVVECFVICYTTGTCIAFPIIIADTLTSVFERFFSSGNLLTHRWFVVIICMAFVMFPLAAQKSLYILSYASIIAISCLVFIMMMIIERFFSRYRTEQKGEVHLLNLDLGLFMAMPLMTVAFAAHYNALNIYREMKNRTYKKMVQSINGTTIIASTVYITYAAFAYLSFLGSTQSDVLNNYDEKDDLADVARVIQGMVICITYPVIHFALRRSIVTLVFPSSLEKYWPKFIIITICLCIFHAIVACFVTSLGEVLSFSGSIFGCNIVFVLPSLFYLRLVREPIYKPKKLLAIFIACAGLAFLVLGVTEATLHATGINKS